MSGRGCVCPHPRVGRDSTDPAGYSLVELLVICAVVAVCGAMAMPPVLAGLDHARARAATRYLATQLALARSKAVLRGATTALRAETDRAGITISIVADGNGNGVRRTEIDDGVDEVLDTPRRLEEQFPGVTIDAPGGAADAVRLSGTELMSFTPFGTSTSGSLYVLGRDGSRFAIRVTATTGRVRTERYDERAGKWVAAL